MAEIKAVIFDLGNVLVDFDHRIAARRISRFCDKSAEEIYKLFFDSRLTGLFEEGKVSPEDFFRQVKETLNLNLDYDNFLFVWNEVFFLTARNRQVYELAKALRGRYKTALISNANVLHYEHVKKYFPILDAFDHISVSYEIGVRKPDPLIYQKTMEALGVSADEVFYTDDREDLIQEAKSLGIHAFLFKDALRLSQDLRDSGVDLGTGEKAISA